MTAGSAFVAAKVLPEMSAAGSTVVDLGLEEMKAEMTSVPMVRGGEVLGYVIIQLTFMLDRAALQTRKIEPSAYLSDAAFRSIYANDQVDFRRLRKSDIDDLLATIAAEANRQMGVDVVRRVLVQQMNFVRKDEIRTNWIGRANQADGTAH